MFQKYYFPLIFIGFAWSACANQNMRDWTILGSEKIHAELVTYDEDTKVVLLRLGDLSEVEIVKDKLSTLDRAWLLEWIESGEELREKAEKIGGIVTRHVGTDPQATEYSVYQPEPDAKGKPPMLILFHPNGGGHRDIFRYVEAAKANGLTLVSLEYFRNTGNNTALEDEMLERFTRLLPIIEATVPHDPNRMFMGGCSGGSWRSFHYSAQIPRPWAGIYSNCGWLGGKKWYHLPYPKMRVAMVNGDKDHGGSDLEMDTARLQEAGCNVSVHAFEGGHQVPPPSVQEKAFRWLLSVD